MSRFYDDDRGLFDAHRHKPSPSGLSSGQAARHTLSDCFARNSNKTKTRPFARPTQIPGFCPATCLMRGKGICWRETGMGRGVKSGAALQGSSEPPWEQYRQ